MWPTTEQVREFQANKGRNTPYSKYLEPGGETLNPTAAELLGIPTTPGPKVKVLTTSKAVLDWLNKNQLDSEDISLHQEVADWFTRGAILATRNPIAALGFNPEAIMINITNRNYTTIGGQRSSFDEILTDPVYKANVIHESIHRGIKDLTVSYNQKNPMNPLHKVMGRTSDGEEYDLEELVIRRIMDTQYGNPEEGHNPQLVKASRDNAKLLDPIIKDLEGYARITAKMYEIEGFKGVKPKLKSRN